MFIGSFFDKRSPVVCSYKYKKRGSKLPFLPNLSDTDYADPKSEKLLDGRAVAWSGLTLLDGGVDICFDFSAACFVDHVRLKQGNGSAIKSVEIFCREDGVLKPVGRFDAKTGTAIKDEEITVQIGWNCNNLLLRLNSDFLHIIIENLDIRGALCENARVFPLPNKISCENKTALDINEIAGICADGDDAMFAAVLLSKKISERYGVNLEINPPSGRIIEIIKGTGVPEGYKINAGTDTCKVEGFDRRGLIYGVETLLQLINDKKIPTCSVEDSPAMEFRGVHLGLPERSQIDFFKRLIKYLFVPMCYNTIFIELAAAMRYDKYPQINEKWVEASEDYKEGRGPKPPHFEMLCNGSFLEKDEVTEIVSYAKDFGFEVIPEIQSLGHVQYITMAFPELAEIEVSDLDKKNIDFYSEDERPDVKFYHSCCPSNEKYYEVLFNIVDEVLEVVQPERFVHMGHDEVYQIGVCELCEKRGAAEMFAEEVTRLHDYLAKKGLRMMMWADMLHDVTGYKTPPAIKKIPKDIVMLDFIWYFHLDKDIEKHLLANGFEVMVGNLYSSHFPRYEERISKKGMIGGEVSTWVGIDEYTLGMEGKMYDFVFTANMLWSSDYDSRMRLSYDSFAESFIRNVRPYIGGHKIEKREKRILFKPDNKFGIPCDVFGALPEGIDGGLTISSGGLGKEIPVGGKYNRLAFCHAADKTTQRGAWEDLIEIGSYKVLYEDGTSEVIPALYGGNTGLLKSRYATPLHSPIFRHEGYCSTYFSDPIYGKTTYGEDYTIYRYTWSNPSPDKKIERITMHHSNNTDANILLFLIEGEL